MLLSLILQVSANPDDSASPLGCLFFPFLGKKMCLILIFVLIFVFEMQWYVAGLLKWNESDGKKQLFSISTWSSKMTKSTFRCVLLSCPIFSKQAFEEWAPPIKVYLLSLLYWKTKMEQRRFSGDDLDSHSWHEPVTVSDILIYTQTQTSHFYE